MDFWVCCVNLNLSENVDANVVCEAYSDTGACPYDGGMGAVPTIAVWGIRALCSTNPAACSLVGWAEEAETQHFE